MFIPAAFLCDKQMEGCLGMSRIQATNLTFTYDGSYDPVFEDLSFTLDTNWRTGLVGRNGKGKRHSYGFSVANSHQNQFRAM